MAALTTDRNTPEKLPGMREEALAGSMLVYAGSLVMRNAAGYLVKASTATGLVGVGRAEEQVDNSAGSNGDKLLKFSPGTFRFANSAGGDEITIAEIGDLCYAVDDQTVAKTDGTSTRSPAGIIAEIDAQGVWVRLDEALTLAR